MSVTHRSGRCWLRFVRTCENAPFQHFILKSSPLRSTQEPFPSLIQFVNSFVYRQWSKLSNFCIHSGQNEASKIKQTVHFIGTLKYLVVQLKYQVDPSQPFPREQKKRTTYGRDWNKVPKVYLLSTNIWYIYVQVVIIIMINSQAD